MPLLPRILLILLVPAALAAAPITPVDTATGGFVGMAPQGPLGDPVTVTSYADFVAVYGSTTSEANPHLGPSVAGFFANGGSRLVVVRVAGADDASVIGNDGAFPTGLYALAAVDEVSFMAAPGFGSQAVQTALITVCEAAGDRMAILDPISPADTPADILAQRAGLSSPSGFAALYYPWIVASPDGAVRTLPPSGFVAGAYAAASAADSPVGVISTALGVAYAVSAAEQDVLNPEGVNAIRELSGIRIWGARTLATDPERVYVTVRRMENCIEESLTEWTAWCLDQTNDATLWAQLRTDADDFMNDLWRSGWLQGATPDDAWFTLCGYGTTMTQTDLDEGRTILQVGWAPVRPAEFLVTTVVQQRVDTTDVPGVAAGALTVFPSPFNPSTTIEFEMAAPGPVQVDVFDARGALVRRLMDGPVDAGVLRLRWDGSGDSGRALSSGVYFVRVAGGEATATVKLLLAR